MTVELLIPNDLAKKKNLRGGDSVGHRAPCRMCRFWLDLVYDSWSESSTTGQKSMCCMGVTAHTVCGDVSFVP